MNTAYKFYVIDDDPLILDTISQILEFEGHVVKSNVSSIDALQEIYEFSPDCVVTDLMMAGVDGLELTRELRYRISAQAMKIIIVSANQNDIWRGKAASLGANGYILKPILPKEFIQQIHAIMNGTNEVSLD